MRVGMRVAGQRQLEQKRKQDALRLLTLLHMTLCSSRLGYTSRPIRHTLVPSHEAGDTQWCRRMRQVTHDGAIA